MVISIASIMVVTFTEYLLWYYISLDMLSHLILTVTQESRYNHSHFADE